MKNISKIIWSEEAINNLRDIIDHLENNWTEREVRKFALKLEKVLDTIKNQPFAFPASKKMGIRRAVLTRQTTIYYEIFNDTIKIVTIFDSRQNPEKLKI
jgi:plasmid stabilization system protein ParE